jgi:hypothetical protein
LGYYGAMKKQIDTWKADPNRYFPGDSNQRPKKPARKARKAPKRRPRTLDGVQTPTELEQSFRAGIANVFGCGNYHGQTPPLPIPYRRLTDEQMDSLAEALRNI